MSMNLVELPTIYPVLDKSVEQELPKYPLPEGFDDSFLYLKHLVYSTSGTASNERNDRLAYELDHIKVNGYADYFLIVWDLVKTAKERFNIGVGPGRGSTAGSLVCYILGITNVDPLKYDLLFERFVSSGRKVLPDIDLDFETGSRDILVNYLKEKYGEEHVSLIISYNKEKDGPIKGYGIHACGIAISEKPIAHYTPQTKVNGKVVTVLDGHYIEEAGPVKLDILELETLDKIHKTVRLIQGKGCTTFDVGCIPTDDSATLEAFRNGETNGIFMFGGDKMKEILMQMESITFEDLVALNAMYRPGPIDFIPEYIHRKNIDCPDAGLDMENVLLETNNMLIYQEQLMHLSRQIAGFSRQDSDRLRKAMGKKKSDQIQVFHEQFMEGGKNKGYSEEDLEAVWKNWEKNGYLLFCKSHAVCYTLIAYQMMYLKVHYPDEFLKTMSGELLRL